MWLRLGPYTRGYRWLRVEPAERIGEYVTRYRLVCQCGWTREEPEWAGRMHDGVPYAYEQHLAWHRQQPPLP